MNYATIKWCDIANGEGVRISLFVSGCTHRCKNCFNEVAWDFSYGQPFDEKIQAKILQALESDYIAGLSLLGGEPLEPQNQEALLPFVKKVKEAFPDKTIWCYTGYTIDDSIKELKEKQKNTIYIKDLLMLFDIIVDGPYIEELRDIRLKFRGSSNQRVIDMQKTLKEQKIILYTKQ